MEFRMRPSPALFLPGPMKMCLAMIQTDANGNKVTAGYVHVTKQETLELIEELQNNLKYFD